MNKREQARFDLIPYTGTSGTSAFNSMAVKWIGRRIRKLALCLLFFVFLTRVEGTPEGEAKTYYVVGIAENDRLKVRSSPSQTSRVVATLRNGDGGIIVTGKIIMNGTDDWIPIEGSDFEGWVRPKFLSPNREQASKPKSGPTRAGLIGELLLDCQNQLIPVVNLLENGRALRALGELCPDSTPSQRVTVRRALHMMVNDEFLSVVKEKGPASMAPGIKAIAVSRDPTLLESPCLLDVIDETVLQLFTHPFGF
jgi:hypothetical protein